MKKVTTLLLLAMAISSIAICTPVAVPDGSMSAADFEVLASDAIVEVEVVNTSPASDNSAERRYKIYNAKNKLVYECRDANDERLKGLLKRSDLFLKTDSSSYYYLAE